MARPSSGYAVAQQPPSDPAVLSHLRSIDDSVRTIKLIVICWVVLTVIGALILLFRR
jgi:hypothetical protein